MPALEDIIAILKRTQVYLQPCSTQEMSRLEDHWQLQLPQAYKRLLYYCGHKAGHFMMGTDFFYNYLFDLTDWGKEFTATHDLPPLPAKAFVFWMHQGYMLAYFICDSNDDPQVHFMTETDNGIESHTYSSLADFLYIELVSQGIVPPEAHNEA